MLTLLNSLAACSSRSDKEVLLGTSNLMQRGLMALALDPFITFGVAQVDLPATAGSLRLQDDPEPAQALFVSLQLRHLTGNAARAAITRTLSLYVKDDIEVIKRVLLKDLRCGVQVKTFNKVFKQTPIRLFEVALAHPFNVDHFVPGSLIQPKYDGVRCIAVCDLDGAVEIFSRSGKPLPSLDWLKPHLAIPGLVLDGEIVSGSFLDTVSSVRRKDDQATDAKFVVFDSVPYLEFTSDNVEIGDGAADRYKRLKDNWQFEPGSPVQLIHSQVVYDTEECIDLYTRWRTLGYEGAIVKCPNTRYLKKRHYGWMKLKGEETADCEVVGYFEGEGKYSGALGGLIVDFNGVQVRVGGGFTDEQRQHLWGARADLTGKIAECEYHEITEHGAMRHPRFVRFRDWMGEKV